MDEKQQAQLENVVKKLAHEIRTPLASILGYAELIQLEGEWNDETEENLALIIESVRQLEEKMSVLNQIIEESKGS